MTNVLDRIISEIESCKEEEEPHLCDYQYHRNEGLEMAISIIEKYSQEPCEDCISRQAMLDINENHHGQMPNHINHQIWQEIKDLPSVKPKAERWIETGNKGHIDVDNTILYQEMCGKCQCLSYFRKSCNLLMGASYCPNCGAKMEANND